MDVLPLAIVVVLWLMLLSVVPGGGVFWRCRVWLADRLEELVFRLRGRRRPPPDPFETIRMQQRLSVLADQIRVLEEDPHVYAKAARLIAYRAAYDDLLDEAFALAGLPLSERGRGEARRFEAELELAGRGWSW